MKNPKLFLLFAASILVLIQCAKKDDNNDDDHHDDQPTKISVLAGISHKFKTDIFELNKYFTLDNGIKVKFTTAQFYLGNPTLMDDLGNATKLAPQFSFIDPTTNLVEFGQYDPNHVHILHYNLGIDSTTNATVQPTDFADVNHPLAPKTSPMWWSWMAGYQFYKFEGEVDYDGDEVADTVFLYHIGLNKYRIERSMMVHSDTHAGEILEIDVDIDYSKIFESLDMNVDLHTKTMNDTVLADKIKANFDSAAVVDVHIIQIVP